MLIGLIAKARVSSSCLISAFLGQQSLGACRRCCGAASQFSLCTLFNVVLLTVDRCSLCLAQVSNPNAQSIHSSSRLVLPIALVVFWMQILGKISDLSSHSSIRKEELEKKPGRPWKHMKTMRNRKSPKDSEMPKLWQEKQSVCATWARSTHNTIGRHTTRSAPSVGIPVSKGRWKNVRVVQARVFCVSF